MAKMIVAEVHPALDGEYDFDPSGFKNFELHAIKRAVNITAGEFSEAYERMDNDVVVAMGLVALMRAGKITSKTPWSCPEFDALMAAEIGCIYLSEEDDASPPELPSSEPDSPSAELERNGNSGESLRSTSGSPERSPSPTGDPTSPTGFTSAPLTSGS